MILIQYEKKLSKRSVCTQLCIFPQKSLCRGELKNNIVGSRKIINIMIKRRHITTITGRNIVHICVKYKIACQNGLHMMCIYYVYPTWNMHYDYTYLSVQTFAIIYLLHFKRYLEKEMLSL